MERAHNLKEKNTVIVKHNKVELNFTEQDL